MDHRQSKPLRALELFVLGALLAFPATTGASAVSVSATVVPSSCGNGTIDAGEECDSSAFGGATCTTLGFSGGSLSCNANCTRNTSSCTTTSPPSSPAAAAGGAVGPAASTGASFGGRAYPKSSVTLLKDSQVAATTVAGDDARFQISLAGISAGNYFFSLYSEDASGNRSALSTFPLTVTSGSTLVVSGIFIAPTIATDKTSVKRGELVAILGKGFPDSEVTIVVNSEEELFAKTKTDKNGAYLHYFDTSALAFGQHLAKSRLAADGEVSGYGRAVSFDVGTKTVLAAPKREALRGDLNNDGKVNLIDFSILAYWYKRTNVRANVDLNSDGKVNLVDFSILAYHWTG